MTGKKPWISHRKAFGRDRDFNYFHRQTLESQFAGFPKEVGSFKEMSL
jgi:hypothetical protein